MSRHTANRGSEGRRRYVRHGLLDILLLVAVVATLSGLYLLRRYARAAQVYGHLPDQDAGDRQAGTAPTVADAPSSSPDAAQETGSKATR